MRKFPTDDQPVIHRPCNHSSPRGLTHGLALVASALTAVLLGLPASAQDAAAASTENPNGIQEIVITGSRIPVPANVTSTSPITAVSRQDLQLTGTTDISTLINNLPQNIINQGADLGNGTNPLTAAGGITTADLRGLGPQRTLILVDGVRLGSGDPNTANPNPAPDLDQIPAALVERIDVVTGGASAVYGSDAIAGVINFIMRKNFQGVEVTGQYGFAQHDNKMGWFQSLQRDTGFATPSGNVTDAHARDLSIVMGTNFNDNAGNITAYFTYHKQDPVYGSQRDFANCELVNNAKADGYDCIGSANSNYFAPTNGAGPFSVIKNQFLLWPQNGSNPPSQYNSAALETIQRQDQRYNAGFLAHLDLNDWAKPYLDFSFMNDTTQTLVAPSGLFNGGNPLTADNNYLINCSNPLLSAQQQGILCTPNQIAADLATPGSANADVAIGRRNVEGGGRLSYYEHTNFRVVGGLKGALGAGWNYNAYGQFAYTSFFNGNENYLNFASIANALQVTGTAANPVCISGGSCVPYNLFTEGGVTSDQLAYLYSPGTAYGQSWEEVAHADVTGDLGQYGIKTPWARDGVAVNVGVEHRFEALKFAPDGEELAGNLSGFAGASVAIDKGYSVKEAFTEVRVPLAQDLPAIHNLTADVGYRYSDYSTAGKTNTYKFEVQYSPISDFALRYSFDRAVRAPNLLELYNPQAYGQQSFVPNDPCAPTIAGGVITAAATASLANCAHTGVTAAQYGNGNVLGAAYTGTIPQCVASQCGQVIGGNPNLQVETADTYSLGLTATPSMLPNFNGSLDYYHIALKGEIGSIPGAYLFNQCLNVGDAATCSQVVRNGVTGALFGATVAGGGYILQNSVNTGAVLISGIDVQANYQLPLSGGWGSLSANFNGAWLQHSTATPYVGAHTYDCAGLFGPLCQTINPTWRHNLRVNWQTPWDKLLISANWRFIGVVALENNSNDPSLHFADTGAYDAINAHIPRYSYLDLSAVWPVWSGIELRGGINNILDKDPPMVAQDISGSTPNSYPTYDYLGRQVFIAFSARF